MVIVWKHQGETAPRSPYCAWFIATIYASHLRWLVQKLNEKRGRRSASEIDRPSDDFFTMLNEKKEGKGEGSM